MNTATTDYLNHLRFGDVQRHRHISVVPLFSSYRFAPSYVSLVDAMTAGTLTVSEVSEQGSVPHLLVLNEGYVPVLGIGGEELIGAKQNRILNTSILLKADSITVVPVSCTECGRWHYNSAHFATSDSVVERNIRSRKSRSVSESLAKGNLAASDQSEVWEGIQALHSKAKCASITSAMHDVFKAQENPLNECLQAIPRFDDQIGLVVTVSDRIAGLDVVSRPEVYAQLHERLVRSYVLDALLDDTSEAQPASETFLMAQEFVHSLTTASEEVFDSVGHGRDHRYRAGGLTGSALIHDSQLIHASFLSLDVVHPCFESIERPMTVAPARVCHRRTSRMTQ